MLTALLERPGEVITREELRQRLWSDGTFVDFDHSISSAMNKLRNALSDTAANPKYIETVGRRGYRFLYPVTVTTPPPAPSPPPTVITTKPVRRGVIVVAAAIFVLVIASATALYFLRPADAASHVRSVAVLPLKNLSNDSEQEYFSEGLTEELITKLASLDGLQVISHTSVMQYKNTNKTLPEIARELKVDAVMEGSVLRSGNRIRITAQLIDGVTERHIWSGNFEREQQDVIALQNEVAREIADKINLTLNSTVKNRLTVASPLNPVAHENYLRGRYHWSKRTEAEFQIAIAYFQQAIASDPQYAPAYAGLADCWALLGSGYSLAGPSEFIPKARAAALKALELDETLAEAHTSLAVIAQNYDWDWPTAEREYHRAIELDPNYATAHHWYAEYLSYRGRFDEALAEIERARELDPLSLIIAADRAVILYYARQYDASIEQFRRVQQIEPSFARTNLIELCYLEKGMYAEATADLKNWARGDPRWFDAAAAYVYGRAGQHERSEQEYRSLLREYRKQAFDPSPLITASLGAGKKDDAIQWLEKAYDFHSTAITSLKVSPLYDPLRNDPRFADLMRRVGLTQ